MLRGARAVAVVAVLLAACAVRAEVVELDADGSAHVQVLDAAEEAHMMDVVSGNEDPSLPEEVAGDGLETAVPGIGAHVPWAGEEGEKPFPLGKGASPTSKNCDPRVAGGKQPPLVQAVIDGDADKVASLVDAKPSSLDRVPKTDVSPLMAAAAHDQVDIARMLLSRGAAVNKASLEGKTALGFAAESGSVEMVQLLLDAGASLETSSGHGLTPVLTACGRGSVDVFERLVDAGAKVSRAGGRGCLELAAFSGSAEIVRALHARRLVDVNRVDEAHMTPINTAAQAGKVESVVALLDIGADPEITDTVGITPLMWAASGGHADAVRVLLSRGVNAKRKNHVGFDALKLAMLNGHKEAQEVLETHMRG